MAENPLRSCRISIGFRVDLRSGGTTFWLWTCGFQSRHTCFIDPKIRLRIVRLHGRATGFIAPRITRKHFCKADQSCGVLRLTLCVRAGERAIPHHFSHRHNSTKQQRPVLMFTANDAPATALEIANDRAHAQLFFRSRDLNSHYRFQDERVRFADSLFECNRCRYLESRFV